MFWVFVTLESVKASFCNDLLEVDTTLAPCKAAGLHHHAASEPGFTESADFTILAA